MRRRWTTFIAAVLVVAAACSGDTSADNQPTPERGRIDEPGWTAQWEASYPETTMIPDSLTRAALESADGGGTLVYARSTAQLEALEPGDVILSQPSAPAPHGLVRKVRSVTTEGGRVIVETGPALITEAVERLDVDYSVNITPQHIVDMGTPAAGVHLIGPGGGFARRIVAASAVPPGAGTGIGSANSLLPLPATCPSSYLLCVQWDEPFGDQGWAGAEGWFGLDINVYGKAEVSGNILRPKLRLKAGLDLTEGFYSRLWADVHTDWATNAPDHIPLTDKPFTFRVDVFEGFWFEVELNFYLRSDGRIDATVEYVVQQEYHLDTGFDCKTGSGCESWSDPTNEFTQFLDIGGRVDAAAAVGFRPELQFWGIDSLYAYGAVEAGLRFQANTAGVADEISPNGALWRLDGTLLIFLGFRDDYVGLIKDKEWPVLDKRWPLIFEPNVVPQVRITSPAADPVNLETNAAQPIAVELAAEVTDTIGQWIECRWTSTNPNDTLPEPQIVKIEPTGPWDPGDGLIVRSDTAACGAGTATLGEGRRTLTLTATDGVDLIDVSIGWGVDSSQGWSQASDTLDVVVKDPLSLSVWAEILVPGDYQNDEDGSVIERDAVATLVGTQSLCPGKSCDYFKWTAVFPTDKKGVPLEGAKTYEIGFGRQIEWDPSVLFGLATTVPTAGPCEKGSQFAKLTLEVTAGTDPSGNPIVATTYPDQIVVGFPNPDYQRGFCDNTVTTLIITSTTTPSVSTITTWTLP